MTGAEEAFQPRSPMLSHREREILNWLKHGKSAWETARIIGISERTVRFHVSNVLAKLGAVNCVQAIVLAIARKEIDLL